MPYRYSDKVNRNFPARIRDNQKVSETVQRIRENPTGEKCLVIDCQRLSRRGLGQNSNKFCRYHEEIRNKTGSPFRTKNYGGPVYKKIYFRAQNWVYTNRDEMFIKQAINALSEHIYTCGPPREIRDTLHIRPRARCNNIWSLWGKDGRLIRIVQRWTTVRLAYLTDPEPVSKDWFNAQLGRSLMRRIAAQVKTWEPSNLHPKGLTLKWSYPYRGYTPKLLGGDCQKIIGWLEEEPGFQVLLRKAFEVRRLAVEADPKQAPGQATLGKKDGSKETVSA